MVESIPFDQEVVGSFSFNIWCFIIAPLAVDGVAAVVVDVDVVVVDDVADVVADCDRISDNQKVVSWM